MAAAAYEFVFPFDDHLFRKDEPPRGDIFVTVVAAAAYARVAPEVARSRRLYE